MRMRERLYFPPGSAPLGAPIPDDPHALSVSLPTWQHNVQWAEADPAVVDKMQTGYPRFFVHRQIQKLADVCLLVMGDTKSLALLFPTERTVDEAASFVRRFSEKDGLLSTMKIKVVHFNIESQGSTSPGSLHALFFPPAMWKIAKSFWQNTGMGISSRYANMVMRGLSVGAVLVATDTPFSTRWPLEFRGQDEKSLIKQRIASMVSGGTDEHKVNPKPKHRVTEQEVLLYPTGMSAIWHMHKMTTALFADRKCVCLGFSYTDSIKVYERWGTGSYVFFDEPDTNLASLEKLLKTTSISAVFTEVPSNPLLQTPNMPRLRELADEYGFLVVVDETVSNFVNADVLQYSDLITTSMSKLFSGSANVMGGSVVINPKSRHYRTIMSHLKDHFTDDYFYEEAIVMEKNSRDFAERVSAINANAVAAAEFLRDRSLIHAGPTASNPSPDHERFVVREVFFPKWITRENYDLIRRPEVDNNFGPLLSITFTSAEASHAFYNALQCAKGPSLGTNFTLACPYTILAHYHERPWAASFGVEEGIVRISVGLEEREVVLGWLADALKQAEATKLQN